jgi:predicted DNA-binding protein with PD1-like motif
MKYTVGRPGRVFLVRLEQDDIIHESLEKLAEDEGIETAAVIILGGAETGSTLVVGPEDGRAEKIIPMTLDLTEVQEVAGTGTIACDEDGAPILHMHLACGRGEDAKVGCVRNGVKVWKVMEAVVYEITDVSAKRAVDPSLGMKLLQV